MSQEELHQAGLKATLPRLKVLKLLEDNAARHLSAEEICQALREQGEDIGLATLYRVLTQFETAGLVHRHHFAGGQSVFELDQGEHHDHLVCLNCKSVAEFVDEMIEERQQAIADRYQFKMTDHRLTIYGLCSKCKGGRL